MAQTGRWVPLTHRILVIRCPGCGKDAQVAAHHVRLRRCINHNGRDYFTFICNECEMTQVKPADSHVFCVLVGAGVPISLYVLPAEVFDVERGMGGWSPYDVFDLQADIDALPTVEEGEAA